MEKGAQKAINSAVNTYQTTAKVRRGCETEMGSWTQYNCSLKEPREKEKIWCIWVVALRTSKTNVAFASVVSYRSAKTAEGKHKLSFSCKIQRSLWNLLCHGKEQGIKATETAIRRTWILSFFENTCIICWAFHEAFRSLFFLYPHRTTVYSNTLKAAKAIKSNQIKSNRRLTPQTQN